MVRLEHLTSDQEALLPAIRDEWIGVGLSTEPADRPAAEEGVRLAYAAAGLAPPRTVIWLDSPLAGAVGAAMLAQVGNQVADQVWDQVWAQVGAQVGAQVAPQVWAQVGDQVWAQVWDQVWDQVWAQVGAQVAPQVWAQVRDQVRAQVRDQVRAQVRDQVWNQVWAQVGAQVADQVWAQGTAQVRAQVGAQVADQVWDQVWGQVGDRVAAQVRDQVEGACWGQHDAYWLAFYAAFRTLGIRGLERLAGLMQVARHAGWWWPFEGAAIITDRACLLVRDERGRLHCEDGPALAYRDGWQIWAWHGIRVTETIIRGQFTAYDWIAESNAEIRRVMAEVKGAEWLLTELRAEKRHVDEWGTLWRIPDPDDNSDDSIQIVEVVNSTPEPDGSFRKFHLFVPPDMERAKQAIAWTFDLPEEAYLPEVMT